MPHPSRLLSSVLLLLLTLALVAALPGAHAAVPGRKAVGPEHSAVPRPFTANYRLEVRGWPNATIEHRLTREDDHWQSRMSAAIAVAKGRERSRFIVEPQGVRSVHYASGYSLLGLGGDYRLTGEALAERPDRQAALFELSRRALTGDCQDAACRLDYQDHRGREERLDYRVLDRETIALPAGEFEAVRVEAIDPEKPERRLLFSFHPEFPGLLLAVEYHRDGQRQSRLSLTELARPD
ncbi:hypothetical protein [Halomonas heilongjiangensis]|uniref:DUF3108 domain-containing protein n=1 Tax=Halomonas heilongjiangensis TaxID=1387883 RepID=A0A2N7TLH3_9GAMM|nr:hypothetical protein [Halomonas heilongjiangensis]PMR68968.1 hypothetical protein C1H66_12670 [Halomonas heilongjiangensis]PXX90074.1 hypothetical protein CR158_09730 [Halomonas heilongjiangensis]